MTKFKNVFTCFFAGFVWLFSDLSYAWNDTTYMLIAMIAEHRLDPFVKNSIAAIGTDIDNEFSASFDFVEAVCWAGDISLFGIKALDSWYEMPIPYTHNDILSENKLSSISYQLRNNSLCFALNESVNTLKNPNSGSWEKNFMLRILMHCVANIHHPLHCINLYSPDFPNGDLGGKLFAVQDQAKNLRNLWDAAIRDIITVFGRCHYGSYEEREELNTLIEFLLSKFPSSEMQYNEGTFEDWALESYQLAILYAYSNIQLGDIPSGDYLRDRDLIVYRQIALAGYRLADLLNNLFRCKDCVL